MIKRPRAKLSSLLFILLVVSLLLACAPAMRPPEGPLLERPQVSEPRRVETRQSGWQDEWEKLRSEAAKEGTLTLYTSSGPSVREPLNRIFQDQFRINLEWVSAPSAQLTQKIFAEYRASMYLGDVYLAGVSAIMLGDERVLQSLDGVLFLPEVVDKKAWWGGELIYVDDEHTWVGFQAYPQPPVIVNTDLVRPGEVKGWRDLLDPKWKGKMVLYNPRTGAGLAWAYHVSEVIMYPDYLREFARQEPIILNDPRQQIEWVARGKNPIGVAVRPENVSEFAKLGAPIQLITPVEGAHLTSGPAGVGLFRKPPHPSAARVFANWLLTKDAGTVLSKAIGGQSARLDVPTDFLDPSYIRQAEGKYFNTITKEHTLKKEVFVSRVNEIFGPLMK